MFELRLGAQLGKSLSEIRAMPYPEFRLWQNFYALEPFGFDNIEFHVSRILAQMYNLQVKKSQRKKLSYWLRDMKKLVLQAIYKEKNKQKYEQREQVQEINVETTQGKKLATERVIAGIKSMFGGRVEDKRK